MNRNTMNKFIAIIILPLIMSVVACQKAQESEDNLETSNQSGSSVKTFPFVMGADKSLYSVSCLRGIADKMGDIESARGALQGCSIQAVSKSQDERSRLFYSEEKSDGRGFSWTDLFTYYYYPPRYYNGYNSNYFCSFIFGRNFSYDCYGGLFGYDRYNTSNYVSECDYCYYWSNPSKCLNKFCGYRHNWAY